MDQPAKLDALANLARRAGASILSFYRTNIAVSQKPDGTPVTEADMAAHRLIADGLRSLEPDIPLLSEEGSAIPYTQRRSWPRCFLVDPLDGTRGFVAGSGEFAVNIALIERGRPVLGVVHLPVTDATYLGGPELGCWREQSGVRTPLRLSASPRSTLRVVSSRSRETPRTDALLALLAHLPDAPPTERLRAGASLKFCMLAEGAADLFPCLQPTSEWDSGAGEAMLLGAGGLVQRLDGTPLAYNKEDTRNPYFLARAPWIALPEAGLAELDQLP